MTKLSGWLRHGDLVAVVLLAPFCAPLAGCGGDPDRLPAVPASGTVLLDDKPLARGTIHFHPEKGQPASGIVEDGKFTLTTYDEGDGAVAGKHRVAVESSEDAEGTETNKRQPKNAVDRTKYLVPRRYADAEHSGLEVTIPPEGDTKIDILLISRKRD